MKPEVVLAKSEFCEKHNKVNFTIMTKSNLCQAHQFDYLKDGYSYY